MFNTVFFERIRTFLAGKKSWLKWLGYAISLSLVVVIIMLLFQERQKLEGIELDRAFYLSSLLAVVTVFLGNIGHSAANWLLLKENYKDIKFVQMLVINGFSQMAKYLPGNVLHLVGRFFLLKQITSSKDALYFTVYETLILSAVAALVGLFYFYQLEFFPSLNFWLYGVVFLVGVLVLLWLLHKIALLAITYKFVLLIMSLHLLSFFFYGVALHTLFVSIFDFQTEYLLFVFVVAFALSFLAGYIMPGASGGIGVREYAFMVLLQPFVDGALALSIVIVFRLCSITGDLVFAVFTMVMKKVFKVEILTSEDLSNQETATSA